MIASLIEKHYNLEVTGEPFLMHAREGHQIFRAELTNGRSLTLRLYQSHRPYEKILADTHALQFLQKNDFPAPRLQLTKDQKPLFNWQAGCWGYAQEFIIGDNPFMDIATLTDTASLLARLHKLASTPDDYPNQVNWLDEIPTSIARAEKALADENWSKQAAEILESFQSLPALDKLPLGLIHTDIHEGNLLRSAAGPLYLLDWEEAGLGQAIFDVALVLGWNCVWQSPEHMLTPGQLPERYVFDEEYSRTLLGAYQKIRPLSLHEIEMLGPAIRFVIGWFAARDIEREIEEEPGISEGLAFTNWAIMRSVTPLWAATLAKWAIEERPEPF